MRESMKADGKTLYKQQSYISQAILKIVIVKDDTERLKRQILKQPVYYANHMKIGHKEERFW